LSDTSNEQYLRLFEGQLKKQVGKKLNDQIALNFSEFDKIEYAVRDVHSDNLKQSIKRTHVFSVMLFLLTLIVGVATAYYTVSLISKRIKQMVFLADNISKGNFVTVEDNRKDELTALSNSLNTMSASLKKNISELESRNIELDKFAYVVSHDLKAPIRGIYNVLQWINEDLGNDLSPEMNKYINIISGRVKRMEDLVNGLLDYARIREKTPSEYIDVKNLVEEIVQDIVPRNFEVQLQNLPVMFGERIKIEQVFTNLISNAVKYTSTEKGKIIISCQEHKQQYEFSVKDNGIGIDAEFHERVFGMFQTLREKGEKESTGIGLAIIKKIIEDQKGRITVHSTSGEGATFVFTWPKTNETP
jgi:signal transduction histidine kinase